MAQRKRAASRSPPMGNSLTFGRGGGQPTGLPSAPVDRPHGATSWTDLGGGPYRAVGLLTAFVTFGILRPQGTATDYSLQRSIVGALAAILFTARPPGLGADSSLKCTHLLGRFLVPCPT
jgi:hypothetical protein